MNWYRRLAILLCLIGPSWLTVFTQPPSQSDFSELRPAISELRTGDGETFALRVETDSFTVLRQQTSEIGKEAGQKVLDQSKVAFPQLKYTDSGYWIRYKVDGDTLIERPFEEKEDQSQQAWHKVTWVPVATYKTSEWKAFTKFLVGHGLYSFQDYLFKNEHEYILAFSPATPATIDIGPNPIILPRDFAEHMRISPKYAPTAGANGFVILLHDPHWSVSGRYETLAGLRPLLTTNRPVKFQFLVEGAYQGTRTIGFAGLDKVLDTNVNSAARSRVVQSLLARYLIDTPMAYRLLYDRSMPALAIDDNRYLQYNAPRPLRPRDDQIRSLINFSSAVGKLPVSNKEVIDSLNSAVEMALVFLEADNSEATDERAVEYYETLAKFYEAFAKTATMMSQAGIKFGAAVDAAALGRDALGYEDEASTYKFAVKRNDTMAAQILASARQASVAVPIAFIGNFHTAGITKVLRENGIGYLVVEPRPRTPVTRTEVERFNKAIHRNTSAAYRSAVRLNKGAVAPPPEVVSTIYRQKMADKALRVTSEMTAVQNELTLIPGATVRPTEFARAVADNGNLSDLKLSFRGGGEPPIPPKFDGAFAYFDPGGPGKRGPAFVLIDPKDARWGSDDRYAFLHAAVFPDHSETENVRLASEEIFYPDVVQGLMFSTLYDANSGRVYCFEKAFGSDYKFAFVALPHTSQKGSSDIRMQVVEVFKKEVPRG
jgi:hypothetical protein